MSSPQLHCCTVCINTVDVMESFLFLCLFPLVISVLASLNLPAAIEDLSGQTVPKSMLDKSAAVIEKGGLQALDTFMQDLPELLQRNREILDEVRTC